MNTQHKAISPIHIHQPFGWLVADEAARLAIVPGSDDLNRLLLQQSDSTVWRLQNAGPVVWVRLDAKAAAEAAAAQSSANAAQVSSDAHAARSDNPHATTAAQVGAYTAAQSDSAIAAASTSDRARANHTGSQPASTISDFASAADARISAQKGAANGLATLGPDQKVPAAQLPSYVDDVLEFANFAVFPATGESGKIYVALDTGRIYRWGGSAYAEISASPGSTDAVPEGANNLYFTTERAQDAVGAGFSAGTSDGASVSYDDAGDRFNVANTDKGSVARAAHEAAADPHPQYTTASEASAAAPVQSVGGKTGAVPFQAAAETPCNATGDNPATNLQAQIERTRGRWGQHALHNAYQTFDSAADAGVGSSFVGGGQIGAVPDGPDSFYSQWFCETTSIGNDFPSVGSASNSFASQLAFPRSLAGNGGATSINFPLYIRMKESGIWQAWRLAIGQDPTKVPFSGGTMSGILVNTAQFRGISSQVVGGGSFDTAAFTSFVSDPAVDALPGYAFHKSGVFGTFLYSDSAGELKTIRNGGDRTTAVKVWTSGNHGPTSGLAAQSANQLVDPVGNIRGYISSNGYFKASVSGLYGSAAGLPSLPDNPHIFQTNNAGSNVIFVAESDILENIASYMPTGSSGSHYKGYLDGGLTYAVLSNGNVQNTNNSYGAISDEKLKDILGTAEPLKCVAVAEALGWVHYHLKSDTGEQRLKLLGVVAQQVQEIAPGLVESSPDMRNVQKTREVVKNRSVMQAVEREETISRIELVEGQWREIVETKTIATQVPVIDEFPIFGANGQPLMELLTAAVLDEEGNEVTPAETRQRTHRVARTESYTEIENYTEKEPTGEVTLGVKYSVIAMIYNVATQWLLREHKLLASRVAALEA